MKVGTVCVLAMTAAACVLACAGSRDASGNAPADGSPPDDEAGTDANVTLPGSDAGPPTGQGGCSSDLQSWVDDAGTVHSCPPDQGCAGDQCIPACDAAGQSHGSVGCNFVVPTPVSAHGFLEPCFAVFVANSWPHTVKLSVELDGKSYDPTLFGRIPDGTPNVSGWGAIPSTGLASGQVAVLFLDDDPNATAASGQPETCPVTPAIRQAGGTAVWDSVQQSGTTGRGKAWHITTDIPVSAYDMLPFGGALSYVPSAELILPVTAWGQNYVTALSRPADYGPSYWHGPAWAQIVGSVDNTTVTIVPTTSLPSGTGVTAAPQNVATTYTVNAGEVIQWLPSGDMSGSIVSSNQPVAFVGGLTDLCLSSATTPGGGGCDSSHQMIPPVSALGSEYVAPPFATRRADMSDESIPYRIVGAADGTTLTYDPPQPQAPSTLKTGQVADFEATGSFVVQSQGPTHPFYVGQHMSGCKVQGGSRPGCSSSISGTCCLGDEEFVNVLPPAEWLQKYVFFTDPSYATTNLVVVREKTSSGFADVTVDCIGTLTGWKAVGAGGKYELTNVDLARGAPIGKCTDGGHVASSSGRFGIIVWGLDHYASYAYPAGGNVSPINSVVVPPVPH